MSHRTAQATWGFGAASLAAMLALALLSSRQSLVAAGAVIVIGALSYGWLCAATIQRHWLVGMGVVLLGYMFFNRGFAYVGAAPIFIGEMMLAWGMLAALLGGGIRVALRSRLIWLVIAFMAYGAFCTVPYLRIYQVDALRDAVIWGYGSFTILIMAFLVRWAWYERVPELYARWLPWFLLWMPIGTIIKRIVGDAVPRMPGTTVPALYLKPGDMAVHLAGVASFLLLGLHERADQPHTRERRREWAWWFAWLVGVLLTTSANRAGLVAMLAALLVVFVLHPFSRWWRVTVITLLLVSLLFVLGTFFTYDFAVDTGKSYVISPQQVVLNFASVFEDTGEGTLENTRQWRIDWWNTIIDYTVYGDYFWTGKGFGVNLADDDGFQVKSDGSLRSPHNGHMTILARAGVPGFVLWVTLLAAFGVSLLCGVLRARRAGHERRMKLFIWILAYWIAFVANASFDVVLEGPQAGVWFWSLMGFGIAEVYRDAYRRSP